MTLTLILLLLLPLVESPTWRNHGARLQRSAHDRSTALEITVLGALGVLAGLAVAHFSVVSHCGGAVRGLGVAVAITGGALRYWSIRTLGRYFTLTLQVKTSQAVVQSGPYRWVRHPSYLGGELAFLGLGLTTGNAWSALLMVAPLLVAHMRRIGVEESMMQAALGQRWLDYTRATARLIPFIY